jgi:hypothetical protein
VSDRERFYIDFVYERDVIGNLEEAYKTLELWSQTYPRRGALLSNAQDLLGGISTQGPADLTGPSKPRWTGLRRSQIFPFRMSTSRSPSSTQTVSKRPKTRFSAPPRGRCKCHLAALKADREQMG